MKTTKKRVVAASLSLHFYIRDGWKREDFEAFVESGDMELDTRTEPNYFCPSLYDFKFNLEKLLDHIFIVNLFDQGMSDSQIVSFFLFTYSLT